MTDIDEQEGKPTDTQRSISFLTTVIGIGLTELIPAWGLLSKPEAFLLAWLLACASYYWLPPRLTESFPLWMLTAFGFIFAMYLALFKAPDLLLRWMRPVLAHGLPILLFVVLYLLYFTREKRSARQGEPNKSINRTRS